MFLSVCVVMVSTACKKNYTCTCQFSNGTQVSESYNNVKKSDAESSCSVKEAAYHVSDASTTCTLNE